VPRTRVVLYQEDDGSCPFLEWFGGLSTNDWSGCVKWDTNCGGPRPTFCATGFTNSGSAFRGFTTVFCISSTERWRQYGLIQERVVPPKEIDRAVQRKERFKVNPPRHTYEEA